MLRCKTIFLSSATGLALFATPVLALDRPVHPGGGTIAVRVADLDRPTRGLKARVRRDSIAHWRYRAAYVRWLHNEYVVAGYPVNQYRSPTYFWVDEVCCSRRWRW